MLTNKENCALKLIDEIILEYLKFDVEKFWYQRVLLYELFHKKKVYVVFWSPKIVKPKTDVFSTCYTPVLTISIIESTAVESRLFDQA